MRTMKRFAPLGFVALTLAVAFLMSAAPAAALPLCNNWTYCTTYPTGPCVCPGTQIVSNCQDWVGLCLTPPPRIAPDGGTTFEDEAFLAELNAELPPSPAPENPAPTPTR